LKNTELEEDNAMRRIIATTIFLVVSVLFAAAQSAKEPYAPGLGGRDTASPRQAVVRRQNEQLGPRCP
jgi:hypothetical protein